MAKTLLVHLKIHPKINSNKLALSVQIPCFVGCPHAGIDPVCLHSSPLVHGQVYPEALQHVLPI